MATKTTDAPSTAGGRTAEPASPARTGPSVAKVGNLTRDPELRFSATGTAFTRFGLAYRPWTRKGEPEAETTFYEVVSFGSLAEHVAESLRKGQRVVVVGRGEIDAWTDAEGTERTTKKIVAEAVGPDLRFETATVSTTRRSAAGSIDDAPDEAF